MFLSQAHGIAHFQILDKVSHGFVILPRSGVFKVDVEQGSRFYAVITILTDFFVFEVADHAETRSKFGVVAFIGAIGG